MSFRIGPISPMQLLFEIINSLIDKKVITEKEADEMIKNSLDPSMSDKEKQAVIQSLKEGKTEKD